MGIFPTPAVAAPAVITVGVNQVDGTASFDADDTAGNDSSGTNGIVRTNDDITYQVEVLVANDPADDVTITIEAAQGTQFVQVPAFCESGSFLDPATLPDPEVPTTSSSWLSLPRQTLTCVIGDRSANSTFVYPISARVRPEVPNGTSLDEVIAEVTTADQSVPTESAPMQATVSARAQFDVTKNSMSAGENDGYFYSDQRICDYDASQLCLYLAHPIGISAPVGGKGVTPMQDPLVFTDDLSPEALYPAGTTADQDWIDAGSAALEKYGARLISCTSNPYSLPASSMSGSYPAENSVRDAGTTTCTQPGGPGTPVTISVSGLDSTAFTYPTGASRPTGTPVPGDSAYVYSQMIRWEIPVAAPVDLGIAEPAVDPTSWSLRFTNTLTDFDPVGIDGEASTASSNRTENDYRSSTFVVESRGSFAHFYTGVPGAYGNTTPLDFNEGWAVWEGPAGSTGRSTGDGQLYPGETTISSNLFSLNTLVTQDTASLLVCNSWDPSLLNLDVDNYAGGTAAFQLLGSQGSGVWITGVDVDGHMTDPASAPPLVVEYGTGTGGAGAASTCEDADSDDGWFSDPALVPGNDAAEAADGVYTAVTRVRAYTQLPAPAAQTGPYMTLGVALRANPSLAAGTILPTWATQKIRFGDYSMDDLLDPAITGAFVESTYDPSVNAGDAGDRLYSTRANARINKRVMDPVTGTFVETTPEFSGGDEVTFQLAPTLTAGTSSPATVDMRVEDCLPSGVIYLSADPQPSVVGTEPADAELGCDANETYVRWLLADQSINIAIDPIEVTVRVSDAAVAGSRLNEAAVWADGDPSSFALRQDSASFAVVQPSGIAIDKYALTPLVELNRPSETNPAPISWRVNFVNLETTGPSNIDVIDVLPQDNVGDTAFNGDLTFSSVVVNEGSTATQPVEVLYTSAATVELDPDDPTNDETTGITWCDAASAGTVVLGTGTTCPASAAEVTGLRVRRAGPFEPSDVLSFDVEMLPTSNLPDDVYVNSVAGRGDGLALLTGPVFAPVEVTASTVGDNVFSDVNFNGVQDAGEPAVGGFSVSLSGTDSDGNAVALLTTQTDAAGNYQFTNLQSGDYEITFDPASLASGQRFTGQNVGLSDDADSDGDQVTGVVNHSLGPNVNDDTVDQGVVPNNAVEVSITTAVQTDPADTAPGVPVQGDGPVEWTYVVTNEGSVDLYDLTVTNGTAVSIDCGAGTATFAGPLAPGDSFTCTATSVAPAGSGPVEHIGTVVGYGPTLGTLTPTEVTDTNPAHHYVPAPAVSIVKYTQTLDVESVDEAPPIAQDGEVLWTYVVTNTGPDPLTNVVVLDDQVDSIDLDCGNGLNIVASLGVGESFTCTAMGIAIGTAYQNTSSVTGVGPTTIDTDGSTVAGEVVDDEDPSWYSGFNPEITIDKTVQTLVAQEATGPMIRVGGDVLWTYVVTNTGNVDLTNVEVVDEPEGVIDCPASVLVVGQSMTCELMGVAEAGQYRNTVIVEGQGPETVNTSGELVPSEPVVDDDIAHYWGATPVIEILEFVNGTHHEPGGVAVPAGSQVDLTYEVTNTGTVDLTDVVVTDSSGIPISCPQTELAIGETMICTAVTTAPDSGTFWSTVSTNGTGPWTVGTAGQPVEPLQTSDTDFGGIHVPSSGLVTNGQTPDRLAFTGGSAGTLGLVGVLLAGAGVSLMVLRRQRTDSTPA